MTFVLPSFITSLRFAPASASHVLIVMSTFLLLSWGHCPQPPFKNQLNNPTTRQTSSADPNKQALLILTDLCWHLFQIPPPQSVWPCFACMITTKAHAKRIPWTSVHRSNPETRRECESIPLPFFWIPKIYRNYMFF